MNILCYGNCQLSILATKLRNILPNVEILSPFQFKITNCEYKWEKYVFFPKTIKKDKNFLKALDQCDIFIAQDVINEEYLITEDLINFRQESGKENNLIITNYFFDYKRSWKSIKDLEKRSIDIKNKYSCTFIDMLPWVKENYNKFNIATSKEKHYPSSHPCDDYYRELGDLIIKEISVKNNLRLSLSHKSFRFLETLPTQKTLVSGNFVIENIWSKAVNKPRSAAGHFLKIKKIDLESDSIEKLNNAVVLNLAHMEAYGHIHTEILPELINVDTTFSDADCVFVPYSDLVNKFVEFFKLSLSKKIRFIKENESIKVNAKKLTIKDHTAASYINKAENVMRLKREFHNSVPIPFKHEKFLIYCSRNTSTAMHGRRLKQENENEIIDILKQYAQKNDLEFYLWTGLEKSGEIVSIEEQYRLFSNAKIVVGPHGGVFTNLIFLNPSINPAVIEFPPTDRRDLSFNDCFAGAILKFAQYYLIPQQAPHGIINMDTESTISLSKLKEFLSEIY